MAIDLPILKADLDKVTDECLDAVRRIVDACLVIRPEEPLADQAITLVLQAFRQNREVFVQVVITARVNGTFTLVTNTSLTSQAGYVKAKRWLFDWFNARKE